jgi:regulator of replication initiation timing
VALIIFLTATSAFYFQQAQAEGIRADRAEIDAAKLESQVEELNTSLEDVNQSLQFLQRRSERLQNINSDLRSRVRRSLVELEYENRSPSGGQTQITLRAANYGKTTATGVQGSCQVYREGADPSYDTFEVDIGTITNRTLEDIQTQASLSEQPKNSDQIRCQIESCKGACQILHGNLERFQVSGPIRNSFN